MRRYETEFAGICLCIYKTSQNAVTLHKQRNHLTCFHFEFFVCLKSMKVYRRVRQFYYWESYIFTKHSIF